MMKFNGEINDIKITKKGIIKMDNVIIPTVSVVFRAFSDENRVRIIKMLRDGERCACKLLKNLDLSQPTLSHHMKILVRSGIVVARKSGKWTYYSISEEGVQNAFDLMRLVTSKSS